VAAFALRHSETATVGQLKRRLPHATQAEPPEPIASAIAAVCRLLEGESVDLGFVDVDLDDVPAFERRIYDLLRAVRSGETITYGELASRAGNPGAARAVGAAMGRNPVPVIIPCHRVLAGGGRSGGFSAPGGVTTKFKLLQIEQACRSGPPQLFDDLPLAVGAPRHRSP
jgi:methylated-DNA-[protein]-cysteine S-methyltransferase